jgi:hypothetical protein
MRKFGKLLRAMHIVRAVTTLAVVAVPVATTVGVIAGYGAYSLLKRMRKEK